jgi:phosphoglycolate phosphatase
LIREAGVTPSETLIIGDSGVDVQTARNAGVRSCGVAWGFQPETFEVDPPDLLICDPRQLLEQLDFLTCSAS